MRRRRANRENMLCCPVNWTKGEWKLNMMGMILFSFTESANYVCASATSGKVTKHRITNRYIDVIITHLKCSFTVCWSSVLYIFVPGSGSWQYQLRGPRGNTQRITHSLLLILLTNSLPHLPPLNSFRWPPPWDSWPCSCPRCSPTRQCRLGTGPPA